MTIEGVDDILKLKCGDKMVADEVVAHYKDYYGEDEEPILGLEKKFAEQFDRRMVWVQKLNRRMTWFQRRKHNMTWAFAQRLNESMLALEIDK